MEVLEVQMQNKIKEDVIKIIEATAFEKDKTYLLKVNFPKEYPKEDCMKVFSAIGNIFKKKNIDVILYPNDFDIQAIEIQKEENKNG